MAMRSIWQFTDCPIRKLSYCPQNHGLFVIVYRIYGYTCIGRYTATVDTELYATGQ